MQPPCARAHIAAEVSNPYWSQSKFRNCSAAFICHPDAGHQMRRQGVTSAGAAEVCAIARPQLVTPLAFATQTLAPANATLLKKKRRPVSRRHIGPSFDRLVSRGAR